MEAWRDDLNAGLARAFRDDLNAGLAQAFRADDCEDFEDSYFCKCSLLLRMRLRGNLFIDQKVVVVNLGGSICFVTESIIMTSSTLITFLRDQPLEL